LPGKSTVFTEEFCVFVLLFLRKRIVSDADLDRVWQSVENGIRSMMEEDSESDNDDD
jgi:hypothetical protein